MQLKKATLQEISSDQQGQPVGDPVEVQFNPTTLHLTISNQVEGGDTRGRQARQYIGSSSTVLTCDLVFDTADEGTTDSPRSVREKTAIVERFVLPKEDGKEAPPKLRFHWGELILDGVVNSVSIDFDHFAADGTPLRAKVALSLQEQNAKYQFLEAGPGANRQGNAPAPGALSLGAVGGASLGLSAGLSIGASAGLSVGLSAGLGAQASLALDGESAAEFAARVGVDPSAWRGLDADLSGGLSLGAGAEVAFSADLSASLGPGAGAGFAAGTSGSLSSSFGLDAQGSVAGGGGGGAAAVVLAERQAGFALSAAGGVAAAVESVRAIEAGSAADGARQAFQAPAASAGVGAVPSASLASAPTSRPAPPEQSRTPLRTSGPRTPEQQLAAPAAPPPPRVDPRAATYGFGVPLRPRRGDGGSALEARTGVVAGFLRVAAKREESPIDPTPIPTIPPWVRLPEEDRGRSAADSSDAAHHAGCGCGCGGKR